MRKKTRTVILCLLVLVFICSLIMVASRMLDYRQGAASYNDAQTLAAQNQTETPDEPQQTITDPDALQLYLLDISALQAVNPDVLGWILLPDTGISYPLVQGADNDYYLNHTWNKEKSSVGAIFQDYRNADDLSDFHTIIYGHRMQDESMFTPLKYFNEQSYLAAHPNVYIRVGSTIYTAHIFSAYYADKDTDTYQRDFADAQAKQVYIDQRIKYSAVSTGITPTADDHIITLSTCSGRGHSTRWVVHCAIDDTLTIEKTTE